ncbi:MAG TPA: globin family protein [Candidatus Limnocylindrales bacterium]|jgi:hemoglobin-like flavoprotein|nr:globin family protein [Candidatus Limnocylindrales bacterium]
MTPDEIVLVKNSFRLVEPIQEQAAVLFYRRLFELDPRVARLFGATDMDRQRKALMQTLAVVVRGLDHLDEVVPGVRALGRRHTAYGATPGDYPTVGAALLWTLEQGLGRAFTPAVRDAWTAAFALLSSTMIEAANEDPDDAAKAAA